MKRIVAVAFLPAALLALETVNLIKDHSFEKNSEVWHCYTGTDEGLDSARAEKHNSEKAKFGSYSCLTDTRIFPATSPLYYNDTAVVSQVFSIPKVVDDLDSLYCYYLFIPPDDGQVGIGYIDVFTSPGGARGYRLMIEGGSVGYPGRTLDTIHFPQDTSWHHLSKDIGQDLLAEDLSPDSPVDSFRFYSGGVFYTEIWWGQSLYWDDVRLIGYADYDVGVKEIVSGDSLEVGVAYVPEARIKNFGREPADTFLAIAEIEDSTSLIYLDTIPYSLPPDTSEIITFADFVPSATGPYTMTIRTSMEPDESDADDALSKPIGKEAISEKLIDDNFNLEVKGFYSDGVLRVSYSMPGGKRGTITLYSVTGRRMERKSITGSGNLEFSSDLPSGVYLVQLRTGGKTVTRKALILR